jgi:photosystem II stability/assembly factor-like uncharacterized protein
MKRTVLALILILSSFSCLTAQCVVKFVDTLRVVCGDSGQIPSILEPVALSSPTANTLNQVWFYGTSDGYIAGENGTFLRSTDSGHTWALTTFLPDQNWTSVAFASAQTGYLVSAGGKIAKTTDGGISFNVIFDDPAKHFTRVWFVNETTGFAIGDQGLILNTTDGNSWNAIPSGTTARLNDIVFVNQVKGFIAGDYDNVNNTNILLTTSDGGNSWVNSVVEAGSSLFTRISFANESVGYLTGSSSTFRTTNGGGSWEPVCWSATDIAAQDDSTLFLCMYDEILKFSAGSVVPETFTNVFPLTPLDIICPDNQSMFAVGTAGLILSYQTPVSYQWSPSTGLNATNVLAPVASPDQTTVYTVTAQLSDGSSCTASARVEVIKDWWFWPELCMVTVDSATSHNRIIWNKPDLSPADSVYLYKEGSVSGQYILLAGYSALLPGEYVDEQSNPAVQSESYTLKVVDRCSFEYGLGYAHRPVHLSINQGVGSTINLIWEPYQGADVFTYNLYRKVATGNPELIASVSGSNTQYTDMTPPSGELTYLVEAMLNAECSLKSGGTSSLSNLARLSAYPYGIDDDGVPDDLRIHDNPANGHFTLHDGILPDIASISLVSMNGKLVAAWHNPSISTFDVSTLAPGLYFLKITLKGDQKSYMQKLVKL